MTVYFDGGQIICMYIIEGNAGLDPDESAALLAGAYFDLMMKGRMVRRLLMFLAFSHINIG